MAMEADADLTDADLTDANLTGDDLAGADLAGANLAGADLAGADLTGANLTRANLAGANLAGADLTGANLRVIKHDVWGVLLLNKNEVPYLRQAIIDGKVDGSAYSGECSCLCGTLAKAKGINDGKSLAIADSSSPAERFFLAIKRGDTPETNPVSKIVLGWIEEFETLVADTKTKSHD
jgi:hypothetical protein